MASEWDVIGDKPRSWELTVAEAIHKTEGKNAYLYVLEKLTNGSHDSFVSGKGTVSWTDWRKVLDHLDFFERKESELIKLQTTDKHHE
jgi:hypothetical protein